MKPILFATSYSSSSENAGDYAAQLAKLCNVPLIVLHSWTLPIMTPEDAVIIPPVDTFHERERLAIDKEVMRLRTRWGIAVTGVECHGYTPDEIESLYKRQEVSLVIMGMHHHTFCSRLLGSVATRSLHNAGYPTLLVPDNVQFNAPTKILFAADLDFKAYSKSLNPLKLFVRTMNATLDIVHVVDPHEIWKVTEVENKINLDYLLRNIPHQWNLETEEDITTGVLHSADKLNADWIAVAPRHFTWLETQFKRSVTENLAFSTNKPILILPAELSHNNNKPQNSKNLNDTMKTTNKQEERAGVWMNHHVAHIVARDGDGNFSISTVDPEELKTTSANSKKSTASEHVRNGKEKQDLKAFFKALQNSIKQFDHILLCGPTTAKSEFHHQLKSVRAFSGKRIAEMSAPQMTDRQLIAFMKKNLGKPMDIFREEEVV